MASKKHYLLLVILMLLISNAQAQFQYLNREWTTETPVTSDNTTSTSSIVINNCLVVTGSVMNNFGETDIITVKYNPNGDTLWTKTFAGSNGGSDYGVELAELSNNNIVIVGATDDAAGGYNYRIINYDFTNGSELWNYQWNGIGNGIDLPTDMEVDENDNIYIVGASQASNGFSDYGILKLNSTGSLAWDAYYDFGNLDDAATLIAIKDEIRVTGGSAASLGDYDIATLKIKKQDGTILNTERSTLPGTTLQVANAMVFDSLKNVYITGYCETLGLRDIQTIKLDSNLNHVWTQTYDGGLADEAWDIGLDANNDLIITGFSQESSIKYKSITIKYSDDGSVLWQNLYGNTITDYGAQSRKLAIEDDGDVYITGNLLTPNLESYMLIAFDSEGNQKFFRDFQADNLDDCAYDIELDGDNIYITGFSEQTPTGTTMLSVKYSLFEKDSTVFIDSVSGDALMLERDLIVRVDPSLIDLNEIDKLEIEHWNPEEIFDPSLVSDIQRVLTGPCENAKCPIKVYRIFKDLTTEDTLTLSRLNEPIKIPKFWAAFGFEFPQGVDIRVAMDSINTLFPDIKYSHVIPMARTNAIADDSLFNEQASLHSVSPYSSSHINIEPAWDIEVGKPFIRVGVFDTGISFIHEDFTTGSGDSVIVDGYDFEFSGSLFSQVDPDYQGHGTPVSGIIGAVRNNDLGVAGIAGGNDSTGSRGVSLYSLRILPAETPEPFVSNPITYVFDAIVGSAIDDTSSLYGYGLNIMNNSWSININDFPTYFIDTNFTLLRESIHFANRAKVTYVASMGNGYVEGTAVPASIDDNWVLTVGGTGVNGQYMSGFIPGNDAFVASTGWSIDVSAPATSAIVRSTSDISGYTTFNGVSSSVPHVSGVVALMMSYINDSVPNYKNLAPEDCEQILQFSADDTDFPGVDSLTGYGRINAGRAMQMIEGPSCLLYHFGTDTNSSFKSLTSIGTGDTISIFERYQNEAGTWYLPGDYIVNTYSIAANVFHPVGLPTDTIRAAWPRHSSSNLLPIFDINNKLVPRERIELLNVFDGNAVLRGYVYEVSDLTGNPLGWWPFDTSLTNATLTYSLLRCDTNLITAEIVENEPNLSVNIYPNPGTHTQTVEIRGTVGDDLNVNLYDMQGRLVNKIFVGKVSSNLETFTVSLENLPKSAYFYRIEVGETVKQVKIIRY